MGARAAVAAVLASVGLGLGAGAAVAASPLVGQWSLDGSYEEGASQVTPDSSGNGLGLKLPTGAMHLGAPALFGTGSTLATNVTPMQVTSPLLAPAQLTLLAWVKQSGFPGTLRYLAGRGDDGLTCSGSSFAIYTGYPALPGLRFYARTGPAASVATDPTPDSLAFDGKLHLLAGTFDGTDLRFYVDGTLVGAPKPLGGPINYALSGGSSFYADGYPVEGCALSVNADDWPGPIDEVRLYDRALSPSELQRLAAAGAGGGTPPPLITDESLIPTPTPVPPPAATPTPSPAASGKAVEGAKIAQAAGGVSGASSKAPSASIQSAIEAARKSAIGELQSADGTSTVGAAEQAQLSAREAAKLKPDPRVQERLKAMKYGVEAQVPAGAPGEVVEAIATIIVQRKNKKTGKVENVPVTLPPAVGIAEQAAGAAAAFADLQFPVDQQATAAMTKPDVAKAAFSMQAAAIEASQLDAASKAALDAAHDTIQQKKDAIKQVLDQLEGVHQSMSKLEQGGVTKSERAKQQDLETKQAKLEKDAKKIEQQRDEAAQKAAQATDAAVTALVTGIASGGLQVPGAATNNAGIVTLPTATVGLSGCALCKYAAAAESAAN